MRIFSGIQPTGRKHLGNHIGAIRQYVEGQARAEAAGDISIYCIVDLHATTVPYDPAELRERLYDTTAILLAAGLDPERCILFRQGDVPEHTELCWLLSSVTALGELNRIEVDDSQASDLRQGRKIATRDNGMANLESYAMKGATLIAIGRAEGALFKPTRVFDYQC